MRINREITKRTMTIKDIMESHYKNEIEVDNSFQRRYVWDEKDKIKLIETIILGYLIPEIFLWESKVDPNTGDPLLKIVDGQQRIGAIIDFMDNKLILKNNYLSNPNNNYNDKSFLELDDDLKKYIWTYDLDVKVIPEQLTIENIENIFVRLNMTNFSLNKQEIRNAQYSGEFIKTAEEIADNNFWSKYKIFNNNQIRRMRDVEFASEILIFMREGIKKNIDQKVLNEVYDRYNIVYEEKENDMAIILKILNHLEQYFEFDLGNRRIYSRITHLYILIVITYDALRNEMDYTFIMNRLKDFFDLYDKDTDNQYVNSYKEESSGASSRARFSRYRLLSDFIYSK